MKRKRPDPLKLIAERHRQLREIRKANRAKPPRPQMMTIYNPDGSMTKVAVRPTWPGPGVSFNGIPISGVRDIAIS